MKEIFDEEKISKYMNNDEAVIVMDKKDFDNNYIHKDKIREIIKRLEKEDIERLDYAAYKLGIDGMYPDLTYIKVKGYLKYLLKED